jgi:hypothetical protein
MVGFFKYYAAIVKRFGLELYWSWRREVSASVAVTAISFILTFHEKTAWESTKVALQANALLLFCFALFHLIRAPWLYHRENPVHESKMIRIQPSGVGWHLALMNFDFPAEDTSAEKLYERGSSLLLRLVNKSDGNPGRVARDVVAKITYFDEGGETFCLQGRWAASTQPERLHRLDSKLHLLPIDFHVGLEQDLDIATKFQPDSHCYAVNNDSFPMIRHKNKRLVGPRIQVKVELTAEYVSETFTFEFANPGKGHFLKV